MSTKGKSIHALVILMFTQFISGGVTNTKGIVLDQVEKDLGLDMSQFGLVVFIFQLGFTLASLLIGYYTDKKGLRIMTIIGSIVMGIGFLGTGFAPNITFFLGFYMIVGFGLGSLGVASNAIIPSAYPDKQNRMFNLAMGVYGLGMVVFPQFLNYLFQFASWRYFYIGIAASLVAVIIYVTSTNFPDGRAEKVDIKAFIPMLKDAQFVFLMVFLMLEVSAEVSFTNFFPSYLKGLDLGGLSNAEKEDMVAGILSLFSVFFMIGRLGVAYLTNWLNERTILIAFSVGAVVMIGISFLYANSFPYLFAGAGFFFSTLFPTGTAFGTSISKTGGSALGLIYIAAGIGGGIAGYIVGVASEVFGKTGGFSVVLVFLALMTLTTFFMDTKKSNQST
ncbi:MULTISPECIES: MFS transporter [Pontibacillus]|uniref:MFS transporter n=1 Tax=Pontibacillus chungwhensis TaxID=265426 RepID=A0ABY8UW94_9BACI|nr:MULTISPECIES: MFS transporter [Pontibacillus]MCD5323984.1 MFS transporter [Pontibacillus sp. HN14]WIF97952.1 MFS transporter [Pontibacillus chungwhensis]